LNSKFRSRWGRAAFSLIEMMITLIIASVIISGIYAFIAKTRKTSVIQRLRADTESITQIAFFIVGRDIRRAGSNPGGAMGYSAGAEIPIGIASNDQIQLFADLNGNGSVESGTEENITYQYVDNPDSSDGIKDQIRRQSGNQLVIENVRAFDLKYQLVGTTTWVSSTNSPSLIRLVRLYMKAGTGHTNPNTGLEDTKEVQMDFMLRNFR
jgi:prepilin-type N-terminal cleavage/methylation domain-containing protein